VSCQSPVVSGKNEFGLRTAAKENVASALTPTRSIFPGSISIVSSVEKAGRFD